MSQLNLQRPTEAPSEERVPDSEIDKLLSRAMEFSEQTEKRAAICRGVESLLETRGRLIREEFERKFQELAVEVKRQRRKYTEQVDEMKKDLAGCICRNKPGE